MATIQWLGAGLSSVPGIRRLASQGHQLILWNRTLAKATQALDGLNSTAIAKQLDWSELSATVGAGDVVVSMLPASMHLQVANVCLDRKSHFVSSSYISAEMKNLGELASDNGLCFVNEVGLDPGLDHLLAHVLVNEYKSSPLFDVINEHSFRSYCGGFPQKPNEFKYKFSWSPLGVLKALKSPAKWIAKGQTTTTDKPWKSIKQHNAKLPTGNATFQAYPNRDSLPFMSEYGFGEEWDVVEFVRGTLRLDGWDEAWQQIFVMVENADGEAGQIALAEKSEELWTKFRYEDGEPDRVVLSVELQVKKNGATIWHQVYCLDECGNDKGSAMSRLVSLTSSIAAESVLAGKIEPGVSAAPSEMELVQSWLNQMKALGENLEKFIVV